MLESSVFSGFFALLLLPCVCAVSPGAVVAAAGAGAAAGGGAELRVAELRVPAAVELRAGARAQLACRWQLPPGAALYSAKWFKDGHEFLRFMPDDAPPLLAFPVRGVRLQKERSSAEAVYLRDLTVATAGLYRCEVSTEGPAFRTAYAQQRMAVIAPPPSEPRVTGAREAYAPGELLAINCTAGRSHPPPHVTWYINGIKAERWFPGRAPTPVDEVDDMGLVTRTLPLRMRAERRHFQGPEARLRLLCEATAGAQRWTRPLAPALLLSPPGDGEGDGAGARRRESEPLAREATRARPPPAPARSAAPAPGPAPAHGRSVAAAASLLLPSVLAAAS